MLIGIALVTTTAIGSIALYKSYAIYKEEKNYNVIQGIIPDFGYDVKVALTVDGNEAEEVPDRSNGSDKYYKVTVNCHDGEKEVDGEWDYNAWQLKIDGVSSGTKCNLAFAPELNKEEYQKLIEAGIEYRRNTYRGKDLSSYFSNNNGEEFYKQIREGNFGDIFVGDYIKTTNNLKDVYNQDVIWLIADIDNYLGTGCNGGSCPTINKSTDGILKKHHVTVIPAYPLEKAKMHSTTDLTDVGYANSDMVKASKTDPLGETGSKLAEIYNQYINCSECTFRNHILTYSTPLTTQVTSNAINRTGGKQQGATSENTWYQRKLDLMDEVNVYGTTIASSSMWDTGIDNRQYAIFRLKPELINSYKGIQMGHYWLKDVVSTNWFASVDDNTDTYAPGWMPTSTGSGVRPRFLVSGETES